MTNNSGTAQTINSVTVERSGLANKAVFSGVVLLDQDGTQLGNARTLNSNNQATIGDSVTLQPGETRTFTVAGNMASSLSSYAGEVGGLNVVAINTSAPVTGSLPITGAQHTMNATLSIGSATLAVSSFDPNASQTKEIGTTGVRFAGIRVTAGSGEDLTVKSIRWNQTGSAGASDINNVVVVANGTQYTAVISSDGKYYTVSFGNGIVVPKGGNIDIYIQGDIVGGPNRTVVMDIEKSTDIYIVGNTYGYGITPTAGSTAAASSSSSQFTTGTPFFDASHLTISAGSATTIGKSGTVPAQNIAVNVPNQPLGAFETNFKGEPVTVTSMTMTVATATASTGLLTDVSVFDENGNVVAGPVDATWSSGTQTLSFTDTVTFPTGTAVWTVKGKVPSGAGNNATITVTVNPSNWGSPTGDVTGNSISLSSFGAFTLNTMTVRGGALSVSVSSDPVAQNIVAGVQDFTFARYQFDATQSGEDVRFPSMVVLYDGGNNAFAAAPSNLASCQMFDGSTPLNTGSNVVNPTTTATTSSTSITVTFDNALTIPRGTIKTLEWRCDVSSSADTNSQFQFGIANTASNIVVTGVTSSNSITETVTAANGQVMTVKTGTLVASEDSTSPSYAIVQAGSAGVVNGVINFRASNEKVTLQRIGLQLTNTASSSASDIVQVTIWDGGTQVGSAVFVGSNTNATSTLSIPVEVPKDGDKDLTVKTDLAQIGTSKPGTQGALIAVDVDTNGTNTQGVGESGTTINATGSTSFSGVRMFSSVPTVAVLSVPSTNLVTGSGVDIYRFSVTASSGGNGIGLAEINVNVATSSGSAVSGTTTVTNLKVYAYTDSGFSSPVSGFTNGQLNTTIAGLVSSGDNAVPFTSILQIPAGATYYFRVVGDTTLTAGTGTFSGSVTTRISGDAAYPSLSGLMGTQSTIQGDANDDFVWSPNATTTSSANHLDWTNGYGVPGLPSDGTYAVTLFK